MSLARQGRRDERKAGSIAFRATLGAQMALAERVEAKSLLKAERLHSVFYAQGLVTMISRSAELAGQCASASLAALQLVELGGVDGRRETLTAADLLARSAGYQALAAKTMKEALMSALAARSASSEAGSNADLSDN